MLHPHGVFSIRLNNKVGRKDIIFNVAAFITLYLVLVGITTFVGCLGNLDLFSSFTGALSMVGNVGPAFGTLKEKGILFDVEDVEVKVSPYYRINGGVVDTSVTYDKMTVQVVLNPATGQPFVANAAQGKANSRLRNGTTMYVTVEAYNKQKQAEASVTTMTDNVAAQLATATVGDDNEF